MRFLLTLVVFFGSYCMSARSIGSDHVDILYLGEAGPKVIRLSIQVDGRSMPEAWEKYVDQLFDRLDGDENGKLSPTEVLGVPTPVELLRSGLVESDEDGLPETNLRKSTPVAAAALSDYFQKLGATGFSSRIMARRNGAELVDAATGRPVSSGFFEMADRNADQRLTPKELLASYRALAKYDLNDDESISLRELGRAQDLEKIRQLQIRPPEPTPARFVRLDAKKMDEVTKALFKRYDEGRDGKLNRQESGLPLVVWQRADSSGDGFLDSKELVTLVRRMKPAAEFAYNVRSAGRGSVHVKTVGEGIHTRRVRGDLSVVRLDVAQIDVLVAPSVESRDQADRSRKMFARSDTDKNGYLDLNEARRFRNFRSTFRGMDRNGDERVYVDEMIDFAANELALADAHITLTVTEQGRDLAEILDANRDLRLSRRELVSAVQRLKVWDRNNDGAIERSEVPRQVLFKVERAEPRLLFGGRPRPVVNTATANSAAPVWFRKMDRNRDGDLSRREFLGTATEFRRFDTNADGLLSVGEAVKVDGK